MWILCFAAGTATAYPQCAEKLPSAAQVLERYVEVTGGRESPLKHKSMTIRGRYQVPARKLDLETVAYMNGGKSVWKFILPNGKEFIFGHDGQRAWDLDPNGKLTFRQGDAVKSVVRDADMYYHLPVMNYFRPMQVVGVKEFNGRLCYHLKGVNNWGRVNEHICDKESGLLVGYAFDTMWRGGKGEATVTFEDYKDFGGVMIPTKTASREGDDVTISLTTTVTFNDLNIAVLATPAASKEGLSIQE